MNQNKSNINSDRIMEKKTVSNEGMGNTIHYTNYARL